MRGLLAGIGLVAAGCAVPATLDVPPEEILAFEDYVEEEDSPAAFAGTPPDPRIVALVGDSPVTSEDLLDELGAGDPDAAHDALDRLLRRRILRLERERLGIPVPSVEAEAARELQRLRGTLEEASGGRIPFDEYLRSLGVSAEGYAARVRQAVEERVTLGLVVRFGALREGTIEVVAAAYDDAARAREVADWVAAGADMRTLAEASPARLPGLPRGPVLCAPPSAFPDPIVAAVARAGAHAVEVPEAAPRGHVVVRLVGREDGRPVAFSEVAGEIEADLRERPLSNAELLLWQVGARRRHGVRLLLR